MFYEYSITPDVFDPTFLAEDPAASVILTQLLRGICENGMISDLHHGGWSRDVAKRVGSIASQRTKTNVMKLLEVLRDRKRLVRHPKAGSDPTDDLQWLDLAREAHGRAPLDSIVLTSDLLRRSAIIDEVLVVLNEVLDSNAWLGRKRSETIKQHEIDYRRLLPKILRHARRIYLIDPYFRPDRGQWTDTIKICASLLGQRGGPPLPGVIEIHTGDPSKLRMPRDPEDEQARWEKWKRQVFLPEFRHTLLVSMWARFEDGERVHDRFLITDQVGFSIAGGLDCTNPLFGVPSDTVWTLLEDADRRNWLSKFQEGTSPFERLKL